MSVFSAHGKTPIALLESLDVLENEVYAAHCVYTSQADHEIMKEYGVTALHCPDSNLKLASGIAPVAQMLKDGVKLALGTDGAASNNNLNMMEEMQRMVLLQKGITQDAASMTAKQAVHIATRAGAEALHTGGGILAEAIRPILSWWIPRCRICSQCTMRCTILSMRRKRAMFG